MRKGIDISEWQGVIDWEQVKPHIDFAIIRLGSGQRSVDEYASRNIAECNRLGIPYGVYWFSYAYDVERARNEARNCVTILEDLGGKLSYPIWFDWEYDSREYLANRGYSISNELLQEMAVAFCEEIKAAGYHTGIYTNVDYMFNHFGKKLCQKYDLWYAYLYETPDIKVPMHQYSWKGKVPGIQGDVDMNIAYKDYPTIINKEDKIMFNTIEEVPEYAKATVQKLLDKGFLQGTKDGDLQLTEEMCRLLVINDRAGLYG